jgi:hypothetical protein
MCSVCVEQKVQQHWGTIAFCEAQSENSFCEFPKKRIMGRSMSDTFQLRMLETMRSSSLVKDSELTLQNSGEKMGLG